jgi:hypothetical protein
MPESVSPDPLPATLVKQLVVETKKMGLFLFGFEPPTTAEVFGPASEFEIFAATAPTDQVRDVRESMSLDEHAQDGWPFYLVVLRGQFVHREWGSGAPPRAIATLIWSPTIARCSYSLRHHVPAGWSRLGAPHAISIT